MNTSLKFSSGLFSPACQPRSPGCGGDTKCLLPFLFFPYIAIFTHSPVPAIQSRFFPPTRVADGMLAVSCSFLVLGLGRHPDTRLLCLRGNASVLPDVEAPRAVKRTGKKIKFSGLFFLTRSEGGYLSPFKSPPRWENTSRSKRNQLGCSPRAKASDPLCPGHLHPQTTWEEHLASLPEDSWSL